MNATMENVNLSFTIVVRVAGIWLLNEFTVHGSSNLNSIWLILFGIWCREQDSEEPML